MHYFYLLRCKDGSLYAGITQDFKKREQVHNNGKGSKYVFAHGGGAIVYSEKFRTVGRALRREAEVKRWTRSKKLELVTRAGNKRQG